MATPVEIELQNKQIPYRFFRHSGPIHSLEQAAVERGQQPEQIIRSILFRLGEGEYLMALVAGPSQVDWRALRQYLGVSRLTMATHQEVEQVTGYVTGAVSPFGLPTPLRLLVDENVFQPAEVSIGSGVRGSTIIMKSSDLRLALPPHEVVALAAG